MVNKKRKLKHEQDEKTSHELISKEEMFTELLADERFAWIDSALLESLYTFYDTDTHIQSATNALLNSVLSSGVSLRHSGKSQNRTETDWNNRVWSQWCRDVCRSVWVCGFAAVSYVEDLQHGYRPIVIDLRLVDIQVCIQHSAEPVFKYFDRLQLKADAGNQPEQTEIVNIDTIVFTSPLKDGQLVSKMTTLWQDWQIETFFLNCAMTADKFRATPLLVTERIQEKFNQAANNSMLVNSDSHVSSLHLNQSRDAAQVSMDTLQSQMVYQKSEQLIRDPLGLSKQMRSSAYYAPDAPAEPYRMTLEDNVKVANHKLPETPTAWQYFAITRQHAVFAAFGVPPFGAAHRATAASSANKRQNVGSSSSTNDITEHIFLNTQQQLKTLLVGYIRRLYSHYGVVQKMVENQADSLEQEKEMFSDSELFEKSMPQITIASIPDEHIIDKLYCSGFLKYEATINMLAQKYGLDIEDFESKPKLSLQDLNNIKVDKPAANATKPKPKTKTKPKKA